MKRVVLVGFNPDTMEYYKDAPEGCEIWTLNHAWKYSNIIPRWDRLFEIHKPEHRINSTKTSRKHNEWLKEQHDFIIYTIPHSEEIPASVAYPYDEIKAEFFPGLLVAGENEMSVFTSSFDYMLALAIYEKFDEIYIYGFAMGADSEYAYQRDGLAYWIGFANARKVKVVQHEKSTTFRPKKPYHEGGQVIGRQVIERHRIAHELGVKNTELALSQKQGAHNLMIKFYNEKKVTGEALEQSAQELWQLSEQLAMARGALQGITMLIEDHDTDGVTLKELEENVSGN